MNEIEELRESMAYAIITLRLAEIFYDESLVEAMKVDSDCKYFFRCRRFIKDAYDEIDSCMEWRKRLLGY